MSEFTIFHNPKCSKSRKTLELLTENGITPNIVEYLKDDLSEALLKSIFSALGKAPKEVLRTKEEDYLALEIDFNNDQDVIKAIINFPKILERPIVVKGEKAVIGRPPENVLLLLN